ncbi:MAG: hypothetical protein KBS35_02015 [Mycoplasma sp.]|nr:hypothetical protein [Candidatus Hennigella equi]
MEAKTQQIIEQLSKNNNDYVPTSKNLEEQHRKKVITIWKYVGKFALLFLTLLAFARVPFIGSYIDGLFDYLLGFGKYLFYCLAVFVLIGWIFNTGYTRVVKSKRFVVFSLLALISACCIISGVSAMVYNVDKPVPFIEGMNEYHSWWLSYFKNWHYSGFFNFYVTGGILAELISYLFSLLSFVVMIIVAIVILIVSIFIIFNINYRSTRIGLRIRGWMVRKLGGTFKYDGYNELKSGKDNQNKFKKTKKTDVEAIALKNSSLPFALLPETDVNKFDSNFKHARSIQNKLVNLFKNANIDCVPTDINVYTTYSEVAFEAKSKSDVQEIIKLQPRIAKVAKLDHYNISLRGNIVNIELENFFFSKFSLRTVLDLYTDGKDVNAIFGLNKSSELVTQNFRNSPSALILGKKGSGAATLTVVMALSTCYITTPENLELVVLNPNCEATYSAFNNLPHTNGRAYESINLCVEKLHDIQNEVNERASLLRVSGLSNIDQYNRSIKEGQTKFKHMLVLIGNVDSLLRGTFQNNKILTDILVNGPKVGVYLVMQAYSVNNDILDKAIYDNVTDKYILTLSSPEESVKIFDNYRGYQLHGNGDCLHFSSNKLNNMSRLQICNINYTELQTDIDVIKTFYTTKQKMKEAQLLSEAKDNENGK